MKTKKKTYQQTKSKYTRKRGGNNNKNEQRCGEDYPKCRTGRCTDELDNEGKHVLDENGKQIKLCKDDKVIELNENVKLDKLPYKRFNRYAKFTDLLNQNINLIKEIQKNPKSFSNDALKEKNNKLISSIDDNNLIENLELKGATNKNERIIVYIVLTDILQNPSKYKNVEQPKQTKLVVVNQPQDIGEEIVDEIITNIENKQEKEDEQSIPMNEPEEIKELPSFSSIIDDSQSSNQSEQIEFEQKYNDEVKELQEKIGVFPGNENEKEYQKFLFTSEKLHNEYLNKNTNNYDFLYPELDDPNFNTKIAKKKEFYETQYDGKVYDVKEQSEKMCNADFELMPHQLFVKNFLSVQTPYNSLLLFHGLGTGKTCSAIGIAEEMRAYINNVGSSQKIFVIASPNVQNNFKLQLFDERKLHLDGNIWNLNTCVGNELLKEVNPFQSQNISKSKIITQINNLIKQNYRFFGYSEFANYIKKKTSIDEAINLSPKERKMNEIKNIKTHFNNHLLIIDEVHNISAVQENKENKKTSYLLKHVCKHADNMRLLLLSATPMYNSYKEIIWITNLLNSVDKRAEIREEDVFDKNGDFKEERKTEDNRTIEGGKDLLKRKLTGYVSYVRGENPYTFPYRIYPDIFDKTSVLDINKYPNLQMNKKKIEQKLQYTPLYMNSIGDYQNNVYKFIMDNLRIKTFSTSYKGEERNLPNFENMESFGYTLLRTPIQCLNIVYPNSEFESKMEQMSIRNENQNQEEINVSENQEINYEENTEIIDSMLGSQGLENIMTYEKITSSYFLRHNFEYKPEILDTYGEIFNPINLENYSYKINNICNIIKNSEGIIMIYSQYLDSGIVPMALALESIGFSRFGTASYTKSLFKKSPAPPIDSVLLKPKTEIYDEEHKFQNAKYVMITGDKYFSPNNSSDLKEITSEANKNGEKIKVVLITKAAAEGLDFKNIRQLHILEPWFNSSRTEQIIGRCVRNLSHCSLPFEKRNVEIYLHATLPKEENDEETADLYIYRYSEKKAIQIGKVTRLLKEISVDCILNVGQSNMTLENLTAQSNGQQIKLNLSSFEKEETIDFQIGDKPFSAICDYMDSCNYVCNPNEDLKNLKLFKNTYNEQFAKMNYPNILKRIRQLFREQNFYSKENLTNSINLDKVYPKDHIDYTLSKLVDNKTEYVSDKYGRHGYLINKRDYYVFQPFEITDVNSSLYEREMPVQEKNNYLEMELPLEKRKEEGKDEKIEISSNISLLLEKLENNINVMESEFKNRTEFEKEVNSLEKVSASKINELKEKHNITKNIENLNSNDEWFKNVGTIFSFLKDEYSITEELILKFAIQHYLDSLDLNSHETIFVKLQTQSILNNKLLTHIESYYNEITIQKNDKIYVCLPNGVKSEFLLYDKENSKLNKLQKSDVQSISFEISRKFNIPVENINTTFGFMYPFKKDVIFKIKNLKSDKNNTGASCEKLGKTDIINRIKPILQQNPHKIKDWPEFNSNKVQKFSKSSLCALFEIITRFYNESKMNKYWFLSATMSLTNKIIEK